MDVAYARQSRIGTAAAIQSRAEIFGRAPVAPLWQVLAEARHWPAWMPGVKSVRLDSAVAPDASFSW